MGEVGSRVSKLPFFDFLLASGGTIETFGPEYPLVMALSLVVFSILLSPTGLRGGLRKMAGEAAFGRSFRNVLFILVERFSIRSDCCSLVILVNDIYKERAEGRELGGCDGPGKYMRNESVDLVIECVQDESRTGMTMKAFVYQNNAFNKHLQAGILILGHPKPASSWRATTAESSHLSTSQAHSSTTPAQFSSWAAFLYIYNVSFEIL